MNISLALSNFLDLSRWIAALIVVASHLRNLVFMDYEALEEKNILIKSFYFVTGFGHQAVIIFFVLSGFLIGGSILKKMKEGTFSLLQYSIDRFARIYIVFPLSLVIGLFFDRLGCAYFNESGVYTNKIELATVGFNISERLGISTFIANFFMLQTISSSPLGSNGPLWSLANEWWYYFYFPLIILLFKYKTLYKKIFCIIAIFGLSIMMYSSNEHGNMLFSFFIWSIGVTLWFNFSTKIKYLNFYFIIFLLFLDLAMQRIGILNSLDGFQNNIVLAILFALTIKSVNQSKSSSSSKLNKYSLKLNSKMASFSYSLYLTHLPLSIFLLAILAHFGILNYQMRPNFLTFLWFLVILAVTYSFSFVFSLITEKNTFLFRKIIYNIFNIKPHKKSDC